MKIGEHRKFVYLDNNQEKVLRGTIEDIDEFTISIIADGTKSSLVIGKRALIKAFPFEE
jgi:hypothetical protein